MIHNDWHRGDKIYTKIEDFPNGCYGFVYFVTNKETDHFYIGKKVLHFNRKRKIGKKEKSLMEGKGRKPSFERIQKESDWKEYYGSSKVIQEELKNYGPVSFDRIILDFAYNKKQLTYLELKYQFEYNVLEDEFSVNDNILGKFYKKDLIN